MPMPHLNFLDIWGSSFKSFETFISFVIVCFGFIVVPGVSCMFFLTGPLFVLYSMHFIPLLIVWCSVSP